MEKIVEFKIRVPEIDRWEDTPVYLRAILSGTAAEIEAKIQEFAELIALGRGSEVRWNYEGERKGHFVDEVFPDELCAAWEERITLLPPAYFWLEKGEIKD